ncbi:hypothetical protein PROFUN_07747 [Planoprotostelium fungivorum]|uniref:BAH domain-containing protein n=1 Tax=Planoprotostelium fungivorum TaxID=1890364 RepID=A0A2P6N1I6_9EUKA|nr:hypothetical protein PROFUN_07747 [Planoprotostelium fungivorum]
MNEEVQPMSTDPSIQAENNQLVWGNLIKVQYESVQLRGHVYAPGDTVILFRNADETPGVLIKISELYQDGKADRPMLAGTRFYRKHDIPNLDADAHSIKDNEVFASEQTEHYPVASIERHVSITEVEDHSPPEKLEELSRSPDFYYRFWYDMRGIPQLLGQAPLDFYIQHFHDRETEFILDESVDHEFMGKKRGRPPTTPKEGQKKRGRPRKDSLPLQQTPTSMSPGVLISPDGTPMSTEKKKRGRPRKNPLPDPNVITAKKKRGRPRKARPEDSVKQPGEETDEGSEGEEGEQQEEEAFEHQGQPQVVVVHHPEQMPQAESKPETAST